MLSRLSEYGMASIHLEFVPSYLSKSRDDIFLRGEELSRPQILSMIKV